MAEGIIQSEMARPEGQDLTVDSVRQNINVPPELQNAYDRVVIAGLKVMFNKESHRMMLEELKQPGPVSDRLGTGIAGLMLILIKQSNGTLPPQVVIPAGMELMMQAVEFLKETNLAQVSNSDIAGAIEKMISILLEKFGVNAQRFNQMINSYDNTTVDAAKQQLGGAA